MTKHAIQSEATRAQLYSKRVWSPLQHLQEQYQGKPKDAAYPARLAFARELDGYVSMLPILYADMRTAIKDVQRQPVSQYRRRTLVRSMFAFLEGHLTLMRKVILLWFRGGKITLTKQQFARLIDEDLTYGDAPEMVIKRKRSSLEDAVKFTYRLFGSLPQLYPMKVDTNCPGWRSFRRAVKIRNHVMHPKCKRDLVLDDDDYAQVINAFRWMAETFDVPQSSR